MKTTFKIRYLRIVAFALTASFSAIAPCAAGPLEGHIEGVTVTATSQHSSRVASRMVDDSGLDALGLHSTDQNNHMWDTNANRPIQFVNFNLHSNYDLDRIHVWQWDGGDASIKAAQNVEILVADTFNGPLTSLGDFVFPKGPGGGTPDPGFDVSVGGFSGTDNVAQVQFVITTNWVDVDPIGNPGGGGWPMGDYSVHNNSRTGMAEVQFFSAPPSEEPGGIISFNLQAGQDYITNGGASPQANGMALAETAGAPGVNVANWNNVFTDYRSDDSLVPAPPPGLANNETNGPYGGNWTDTYGDPVDDQGNPVTGMTINWYDQGSRGSGGSGADDQKMFSSDWDGWNRGGDSAGSPDRINSTGPPDSQITVTGIPYSRYDVYAYVGGASESWGDRGGTFSANGIEKGLSFLNVADGVYVEVPTDGPFELQGGGNTSGVLSPWDGTFVHFTGLSGDLTLISDATTHGGQRLRFAGFQIVNATPAQVIPEPSTFVLAALGLLGLGLFARRRRHTEVTRPTH